MYGKITPKLSSHRFTDKQRRFCVDSIRIMACEDKNPERVRNFVRINYRVEISLTTAKRWWVKYVR